MCATEKTFILALQLAIISNCISLNRLLLKILDIAFGVDVGFLAGNGRGVEEHPGVVFHVNIAIELMSMQLFSVNLPIAIGMILVLSLGYEDGEKNIHASSSSPISCSTSPSVPNTKSK